MINEDTKIKIIIYKGNSSPSFFILSEKYTVTKRIIIFLNRIINS